MLSYKIVYLLGLPFILLSQASIFCLVSEKACDGKDYLLRPEQTPAVQCVSCFFTVNSFFLLHCIIFFPSLDSSLENSRVYLFSLQLLWRRASVFCSSVYWAFSTVPRTPKLKGSKGRSIIRDLSLGGTEHQNSHCNSSISYFHVQYSPCHHLEIPRRLIASSERYPEVAYKVLPTSLIYSAKWVQIGGGPAVLGWEIIKIWLDMNPVSIQKIRTQIRSFILICTFIRG